MFFEVFRVAEYKSGNLKIARMYNSIYKVDFQ